MYPLAHCELPHNYCYRLYRIRMQELPLRGLHWYTGPTGTTGALVQLVHWYNWYIGTLVQLVQLVHWYNLCTGTTRRNVLLWKKHSFAGRQMHFFGPAHALVAWLKTFLDLRSCNLTMDETINTLNIFDSKKWNPEPYIFHVDQKTHIWAGARPTLPSLWPSQYPSYYISLSSGNHIMSQPQKHRHNIPYLLVSTIFNGAIYMSQVPQNTSYSSVWLYLVGGGYICVFGACGCV